MKSLICICMSAAFAAAFGATEKVALRTGWRFVG